MDSLTDAIPPVTIVALLVMMVGVLVVSDDWWRLMALLYVVMIVLLWKPWTEDVADGGRCGAAFLVGLLVFLVALAVNATTIKLESISVCEKRATDCCYVLGGGITAGEITPDKCPDKGPAQVGDKIKVVVRFEEAAPAPQCSFKIKVQDAIMTFWSVPAKQVEVEPIPSASAAANDPPELEAKRWQCVYTVETGDKKGDVHLDIDAEGYTSFSHPAHHVDPTVPDCTAPNTPPGCRTPDCTAPNIPYEGCTVPDCTAPNIPYEGCTVPDCTAPNIPYEGCTVVPLSGSAGAGGATQSCQSPCAGMDGYEEGSCTFDNYDITETNLSYDAFDVTANCRLDNTPVTANKCPERGTEYTLPEGCLESGSVSRTPTPAELDLDGDGRVEVGDLLTVLASYGRSEEGDVTRDGVVDVTDLLATLAQFNTCVDGSDDPTCQ